MLQIPISLTHFAVQAAVYTAQRGHDYIALAVRSRDFFDNVIWEGR